MSAPGWGVTHHSLAARQSRPTTSSITQTPRGRFSAWACLQSRWTTSSAWTPIATHIRRRSIAASTGAVSAADARWRPTHSATSSCCGSRSCTQGPARMGDRVQRQFRRRARDVPARARRMGRRGRAPERPARRNGAKSDELDAIRAAREALSRDHLAQPRRPRRSRSRPRAADHPPRRDPRPDEGDQPPQGTGRHRPRGTPPSAAPHTDRRARLPLLTAADAAFALCEHRATVIALRHTARRILALEAEANDLESEIERSSSAPSPSCWPRLGVGPISAAQLYCSWSHHGRIRHDAAFAMLGGSAPIPASSGADDPLPPQPRRRPPAQLRAAHDRAHPPAARSRHPRLRRPATRRGQDATRDQALPQALPRPPPLPHPRSQRATSHRSPSPAAQPHDRSLTNKNPVARPETNRNRPTDTPRRPRRGPHNALQRAVAGGRPERTITTS